MEILTQGGLHAVYPDKSGDAHFIPNRGAAMRSPSFNQTKYPK